MTNVPIGRPWQMLAVDVLEVPISGHGNRYLLVLQDYFTKWAEALPMPDQTAERIVRALIDIFSRFGIWHVFAKVSLLEIGIVGWQSPYCACRLPFR